MAEELLDQIRDLAEGQIDFEGQRLADLLATSLLTASGVLSFIVGYWLQDIKLAVLLALAGSGLTCLLVVPPWPFFNLHPAKWLVVGDKRTTVMMPQEASEVGS